MQRKLDKIKRNRNKNTELKDDVIFLETYIKSNLESIWGVDELNIEYRKLMNLDVDERRLFLVYILLNQSIVKTSRYFEVDRKTVSTVIRYIKDKIQLGGCK